MKKILLLCLLTTGMLFAQTNVSSKLDDVSNTVNSVKELANNVKNLNPNVSDLKLNQNTSFGQTGKNAVSTVYGDGKSLVQTVYGDLKGAGQYFTPKIESAVEQIAKGFKVGTVYLWNILVKQQRVWSWCYLIGILTALFAWGRFYYTIKQGNANTDAAGEWKNHNVWISFVTLSVAVVLSFFSFQHIVPMMTGFINPEFGAMQNVIEVAKSLK
jgi:hypothetical protein